MNKLKEQNKGPSNKLIETKDILFIWKLFIKNIGFMVIIPIMAYVVGYIYIYRLADVYGVKAQMLLKSNETYDYQDPIYKGLGAYGVYMDVQNQIRILKSRDLVGEVVDKIKIETSYYVVGRLKRHEVFETLPFKTEVNVINTDIYEVPIKVEIINIEECEIVYELYGQEQRNRFKFNEILVTDNFILNLKKRYRFTKDNIGRIKSSEYEIVFHSRDFLISKYLNSLSVENIEHTSILDVHVTDQLAQRAKVFMDTLTHVYVDYSRRIQLEVNENTLNNIDRQIDTVSVFIEEKERELLRYKDENAILNPIKEEEEYFEEYVNYSKEKRELEKRKGSILALRKYMETSVDPRALPPSEYIEQNDLYLKEAVSALRSLQVELEILLTQNKEESFLVSNQKKKIVMQKQDILAYIENLLVAMNKEINLAQEFIDEYRKDIIRLPRSEQGIANIQRQLDVNNRMYIFLLEKKTNTLIARAGIIPQVRVIETPIILGVVEPDKTKLLRLFILGGVILALLIAVIRKLFFEKIENVNELAEITDMNIMGGIPYSKHIDNDIVVQSQPKSHITESFRTIRTNLSFMGEVKGRAKRILVSSYFPGEGKTFCSTNLAALLARADKKVLVVDFDLHRPRVHKIYDLDNSKGVSSYLIGKTNFDKIVRNDVYPNLDVITSGPIPPNASELVLRESVDEMLKYAESRYDFILIDTPPFGLLNDTLELTKKSDVLLIIMNIKYARRRGVRHIEELTSKFSATDTGVILNGIKQSKLQYYYSKYAYKYSYGYNYGYGYGYGGQYTEE